jgi:hypothetical protein
MKTKFPIVEPSRDLKIHMTELRKKDPKVHEFLRTMEAFAWEARTSDLTYSESERRWRMMEEACQKTLPELTLFCKHCTKDFKSSCKEEGQCLHISNPQCGWKECELPAKWYHEDQGHSFCNEHMEASLSSDLELEEEDFTKQGN